MGRGGRPAQTPIQVKGRAEGCHWKQRERESASAPTATRRNGGGRRQADAVRGDPKIHETVSKGGQGKKRASYRAKEKKRNRARRGPPRWEERAHKIARAASDAGKWRKKKNAVKKRREGALRKRA